MIQFPIKEAWVDYTNDLSGDFYVTFRVPSSMQYAANSLGELFRKGPQELEVSVSKFEKPKSKDSVKKLWACIHDISELTGVPEKQVYMQEILQHGFYSVEPVKDEDLAWRIAEHQRYDAKNGRGSGNIAEILGPSKQEGYTNVKFYFGCSGYDQQKMNRLIDGIVQDLEELQNGYVARS